jgi:hypothetical protein
MVWSSWRHHILNCFGALESIFACIYNGLRLMAPSYLNCFRALESISACIYNGLELMAPSYFELLWSSRINICMYIQWFGAHGAIILWTALELWNQYPRVYTMVWRSWRHHILNSFGALESISACIYNGLELMAPSYFEVLWSSRTNIRVYIQWFGAHGAIIFWTASEL